MRRRPTTGSIDTIELKHFNQIGYIITWLEVENIDLKGGKVVEARVEGRESGSSTGRTRHERVEQSPLDERAWSSVGRIVY